MTINKNNEYEDDYCESNEFDLMHFEEECENEDASHQKQGKRKKRLEDWLEEKRLNDESQNDTLDS